MSVPHYDPEYYTYADQYNDRNSGYRPTWGPNAPQPAPVVVEEEDAALAPLVLRDCENPLCCHRSYALFCSEYCRETLEGVEEIEEDAEVDAPAPGAVRAPKAYYADTTGAILLGECHIADTQYAADEQHGLVWLACYGGRG